MSIQDNKWSLQKYKYKEDIYETSVKNQES